jgi:hypothetical protein
MNLVNASRIQIIMDGGDIKAYDRSLYSTTACTRTCGWYKGAILAVLKYQYASTISKHLFINVAESIEIFSPILHLGCLIAC